MSNQSFSRRLEHLERLTAKAASLIEQYEEILLVERDPRRRDECLTNIEQLRNQVAVHRNEYNQLLKTATANDSTSLSETGNELAGIEAKLGELLDGQEKIKAGVDALFPYYETGQRAIIAELTKHFDRSQFAITREILRAIETNLLPESTLRQLIDSAQLVLAQLRDQNRPLPQREKIEAALSDSSRDIKHKVKLTIPLIPILLRYEGEIELGNLRQQWDALKNRVGEREPLSRRFLKLITLAIAFLAVLIAGSYIYIRHRQTDQKPTASESVANPSPTPAQISTLQPSPKRTPTQLKGDSPPRPSPSPPEPIVPVEIAVSNWHKRNGETVHVKDLGKVECGTGFCKSVLVEIVYPDTSFRTVRERFRWNGKQWRYDSAQ